jgi:eukaryotic-like serine/threonine-protein kinase
VIGLRINNYEITSLVGEGGMGAVYLAVHPVMGRKVAVKLLRRELAADKTLVARFINEARAAYAIHHPNIIDVIDVGTLADDRSGLPYMMMEYLEGESLARRLELRGTLGIAEAVDVAIQTASALGAAHAKGIVHRDLKPDNLFLVSDEMNPGRERIKVLDFGIAKLRGEFGGESVKTNAGSIMGTPPYMSPEQCRGIVEEVDHRTDVYALGIILYEMLCGSPPFVSAGYGEVLVMHLTQPPPSPRAINPNIPEPLEAAILKALAKNRDQRFASMGELQAALGRIPTAASHRVVRDPTPVEIAPTYFATPAPRQATGPERPPTPKSTTFSATTGIMTAIETASRRSARRRAVLVAGGVATLVVAGGLAARTVLAPATVTVRAGGAPPAPPRVVAPEPVPPPAPPPPAPEPAKVEPVVAAPAPEPVEPPRRTVKRTATRKAKPVASAPAAPTVVPTATTPAQAPAPAPPAKKPAEKW